MFPKLKLVVAMFFILLNLISHLEAKTINRIVAWVNDDIITEEELNKALIEMDIKPKEEVKSQVLEKLIEEKLVLQAAYEKKIEIDPTEVEETLSKIKSKFTSDEEFEKTLASEGLAVEDLKEKYSESLLKREIISFEVHSKISISEEDVEAIRDSLSCQIRVRHILVKSRQEAILLLARLDRGEKFEDLAKEYSICPSRKKGGELDFFSPHQMVKEFSAACLNLAREGEISGIVKTQLGFHIIILLEKRKLLDEELNQLVEEQKDKLREEKFKKEFSKWMDSLKKKAYIKLNM